jgi:hypothetical protein
LYWFWNEMFFLSALKTLPEALGSPPGPRERSQISRKQHINTLFCFFVIEVGDQIEVLTVLPKI